MMTANDSIQVAANAGPMAKMTGSTQNPLPRRWAIVSWLLQLVSAAILVQTLFFKFTAAEESVYIFTKLGMEPWGRIGSGIAELIASALLLIPRTSSLGALFAIGVISGAIVSHLTKLGIVVKDDGGLLFGLALVVFGCSLGIVAIRRSELVNWIRRAREFVK